MNRSSKPHNVSAVPPASLEAVLSQIRFVSFCVALAGTAFSNSVASIGAVAYALTLILSGIRSRKTLPAFPLWGWALALTASVAVSSVTSQAPNQTFQGLLKFAWSLLMFYAGWDTVRSPRRAWGVLVLLLACEGLSASSALGQDWMGLDWIRGRSPMLYTESITRLTGPFKHCNDFGTFLIPGWVLGCALFFDRAEARRWLRATAWLLFLTLMGWVLFRTMSRSAMLGAATATAILAIPSSFRRPVLIGVLLAGWAAWVIPSPFADRLHRLLDFGDGGIQERLYLLEGASRMIHAAPWFGLGPNTYSSLFAVFNPPDPQRPIVMYAHNSYLQMAAEIGLVGLASYLLFLLAVLVRAARPIFQKNGQDGWHWIRAGFWASLIGILVNALFDSLLQSTQLRTLFWGLLGVSLALGCLPPRNSAASQR